MKRPLGKDFGHLGVDFCVCGENVPVEDRIGRSVEPGDPAARFLHDEHCGRRIPRMEIQFPESVEPAARDIAHVERGRTRPPYGPGALEKADETVDVIIPRLFHVIGKAGGEERLIDIPCL